MERQRSLGFLGAAAALSALAHAAKGTMTAINDLVENVPFLPIRRVRGPSGRKSFGTRYSGPTKSVKKQLPNGGYAWVPEPVEPEYVGGRMYATAPSRRDRQRRVNFGSVTLPPGDANRILAAEAKRNRKADRNLTLAHRGAFN